jgi:hypothetical protein
MRIRSFTVRGPSPSPWPTRLALAVIGIIVLLVFVLAARNLRRHDALVQWRTDLERAAGSPTWPAWSPTWPDLPPPARRRHRLPVDLRGPYAYAATHPEVLERIPCYCGCVDEGHQSIRSCFVSSFRTDGTPVWTNHSFNCEMCVHIAREVMLMSSRGMSLSDIRGEIDRQYGHGSHQPTNTPLPNGQSMNHHE